MGRSRLDRTETCAAGIAVDIGTAAAVGTARRRACSASASVPTMAASTTSAPCQFMTSSNAGTSTPITAMPTGNPACLTEKARPMRCAGVTCASNCELDGVMGPTPNPISTMAISSSAGDPLAAQSMASAMSSAPAWLARNGPRRRTTTPASRLDTIAPPRRTATKKPNSHGASPKSASITGPSTVGALRAMVVAICSTSRPPMTKPT